MHDHSMIDPGHAHRLNDERRLQTQLSEPDLVRLLALRGDEDLLDLGSGTGFYTGRMAALTTGTVYAVELQPEMNDLHRKQGLAANVRLVPGDIRALPLAPRPAAPGPESASASIAPEPAAAGAGLAPASVDVACCIATWHEIDGRLDLPGLAQVLRPPGRLLVIDWRRDAESMENGPPEEVRSTGLEVAAALAPVFAATRVEALVRFMFAVVAVRTDRGQ